MALLVSGLLLGVLSALIAIWPSLSQGGGTLPLAFLIYLLGSILLFGVFVCWLAVSFAIKGRLIDSMRRE